MAPPRTLSAEEDAISAMPTTLVRVQLVAERHGDCGLYDQPDGERRDQAKADLLGEGCVVSDRVGYRS